MTCPRAPGTPNFFSLPRSDDLPEIKKSSGKRKALARPNGPLARPATRRVPRLRCSGRHAGQEDPKPAEWHLDEVKSWPTGRDDAQGERRAEPLQQRGRASFQQDGSQRVLSRVFAQRLLWLRPAARSSHFGGAEEARGQAGHETARRSPSAPWCARRAGRARPSAAAEQTATVSSMSDGAQAIPVRLPPKYNNDFERSV